MTDEPFRGTGNKETQFFWQVRVNRIYNLKETALDQNSNLIPK